VSEPPIVTKTRAALLSVAAQHDWPTAESKQQAIDDLLDMLAHVPYEGDDDAYAQSAWAAACVLMHPRMMWIRRVLELLNLETTRTIH
jgi:hypothetical protein